jgi:hypothetical protein
MSCKPLLSFRPKAELAEQIKAAAAEDRRPMSQFISNLIEDALAARRAVPAGDHRSAA